MFCRSGSKKGTRDAVFFKGNLVSGSIFREKYSLSLSEKIEVVNVVSHVDKKVFSSTEDGTLYVESLFRYRNA